MTLLFPELFAPKIPVIRPNDTSCRLAHDLKFSNFRLVSIEAVGGTGGAGNPVPLESSSSAPCVQVYA